MPSNYFWWCSMFTLSVEFPWLYFTREQKEVPCVLSNHASKRREKCFVIWVLQVAKARRQKKRYSTYLEKNNQNLRETSSKHGFLPLALVVLFEENCHLLGRHKMPPAGKLPLENIPCSPSVAALRPDVFFFCGGSWIRILKKSADSTMAATSPPVSEVIKLLSLQKAERLFLCWFFHQWYTPPEFTNLAGWENHQFEKRRYIDSKAWDPAWGTSSTSSCDLTSMDLPSCSLWMVASPAHLMLGGHVIPFSPIKSHGSVPISIPRVCGRCHLTVLLMVGDS